MYQPATRFCTALGVALLVCSLPLAASAQQRASEKAAEPAANAVEPAKANQYCMNIADAATDARHAWQKEQLAALEKEIEERIKVLEQKRAEYEEWLRRRNEFLEKADQSIVAIYSRMRPDAAALQLANLDDETAAAILTKLNPRSASAVLNEMEPARAAQLTGVMTDSAKRNQDSRKSG